MYANGTGVKQDFEKAAILYRLAAKQGFSESQYNLAVAYGIGEGVSKDFVKGYAWMILAAYHDNELAREAALKITPLLTEQQLLEANNFAIACLESNYLDCN